MDHISFDTFKLKDKLDTQKLITFPDFDDNERMIFIGLWVCLLLLEHTQESGNTKEILVDTTTFESLPIWREVLVFTDPEGNSKIIDSVTQIVYDVISQ